MKTLLEIFNESQAAPKGSRPATLKRQSSIYIGLEMHQYCKEHGININGFLRHALEEIIHYQKQQKKEE